MQAADRLLSAKGNLWGSGREASRRMPARYAKACSGQGRRGRSTEVSVTSSSFFAVDRFHKYYAAPPGKQSDPPGDMLGGWVGICEVLGASSAATVSVIITRAYATGFEFTVETRVTPGSGYDASLFSSFYSDDAAEVPEGEPPGERLRVGLEFPSGARTSTLPWSVQQQSQDALVPVLWMTGGGSTSKVFTVEFWISPLPSPGSVRFVIEWPLMNIPEQDLVVPCASILQAAGKARLLGQPGRAS